MRAATRHRAGVGLYVLDQASKLWIVHRFPLNYLNEKVHKYAYLPDFPGFHHVNADGTLDFATNGHIPAADMAQFQDQIGRASCRERV